MNGNIIQFSSRTETAVRLRQSLDRWRSATGEWIEATLDLASQLWQARQQFPSDQQFGFWLVENDMDDLGKNDRAALIGMGQHLELSRRTLEDTDRSSPQHIWRELIRPKLLSSSEETAPTSSGTPKRQEMNSRPENCDETPPASPQKQEPVKPEVPKVPVASNSSLHGLKRAEELAAIYSDQHTRANFKKMAATRAGKQILDLILKALDAGLLKPTNSAYRNPTLRIILPGLSATYCRQFDLMQTKDRSHVQDVILPAAIANRDAILQAPENTQAIIETFIREQRELKQKEDARLHLEKQIKELPADEEEIIMYGQRLWPRPEGELYSYRQLRSGIWWFRDLNRWLDGTTDSQPKSRALKIRHLVNWPHQFARHELDGSAREKLEKLVGVVHKLSRLLESNPTSDERQWKFPPEPKSENEEW